MASARGIASLVARRSLFSTTTMGTTSISLEKIDARVFCLGTEGGNPVTIFASSQPLSESLQEQLAKSCDWESVMVGTEATKATATAQSSSSSPIMAFFMPSGEQVSFCAHAAIGGAIAMGKTSSSWDFRAAMTGDTFTVDTEGLVQEGCSDNERTTTPTTNTNDTETRSEGVSCRLQMQRVDFEEAPLSSSGLRTLEEWSERCKWIVNEKTPAGNISRNASVARPKTLVELPSVEALHQANPPPCDDGKFATACTAMDDSTGVYLYAPTEATAVSNVSSYECRQFPRSSGYPEDPATGIAAAALAASLQFGGAKETTASEHSTTAGVSYDIYQGTAMGRPSLIQVVDLERDQSGKLSFGLQGRVEIDATSTIQVSE